MVNGKATYEDWKKVAGQASEYSQRHQNLVGDTSAVLGVIAESDISDEDKSAAMKYLTSSDKQKIGFLESGLKKAKESTDKLSSRDNLENILASVDNEKLEEALKVYPVDPEKVDNGYQRAAELYREIASINGIVGEINEGNEDKVKNLILGTLKNHFDGKYPDKSEGKDYELIKDVLMSYALASKEFRISRFEGIIKGELESKGKEFYEIIGGKDNIGSYIDGVLKDEEIPRFYATLAQIEQSKSRGPDYASAS